MNDWQGHSYVSLDSSPATPEYNSAVAAPRIEQRPVGNSTRAVIGGAIVDLRGFDEAIAEIMGAHEPPHSRPLAVVSANLDHITHFGAGSRWLGSLDAAKSVQWLTLLDGAPLRAKANELTGRSWPRLAGSDLINPLLDEAERKGLRVGFLGGSEETHQLLQKELLATRPRLRVSGWWAPGRSELADHATSTQIASDIERSGTDMLVVGLGKPRQELWIAEFGALTGASVLLAFGAVVDFLAGRIKRAPVWVSNNGLEWAWRLSLEPRRLAHRYLVDGPEALRTMKKHSHFPSMAPSSPRTPAFNAAPFSSAMAPPQALPAPDIVTIVVTHNNVEDIAPLMTQLRAERAALPMRIVVADNSSVDGTWELLQQYPDVISFQTGGNFGQAGGVNRAMRYAGPAADCFIVTPSVRLAPGVIAALRRRMDLTGAGIVVPQMLDENGELSKSIRWEPDTTRSLGDAFFGTKLPLRPRWLSEIDFSPESYAYPHKVDWAISAAMLVHAEAAALVGDWDEQFNSHAEWTDFFRRSRDLGVGVWYEPSARLHGTASKLANPAELRALMAVNKVRYAKKHRTPLQAALTHGVLTLAEAARSYQPNHRAAARALLRARI